MVENEALKRIRALDVAASDNNQEQIQEAQKNLSVLCGNVREKQPELINLNNDSLNINGRMPKNIALGKYHIKNVKNEKGETTGILVPHLHKFPFEKSMYIGDEEHIKLLQKIILRLMYALPIDKQEYYVYDPKRLGGSVAPFRPMFANENFFPQKKVMVHATELKKALAEVLEYARSVIATSLDDSQGMYDWESYNLKMAQTGDMTKLLPYKVFVFFDVPMDMDQECFEAFQKLIYLGAKCGFLVLYSFDKNILEADDFRQKKANIELKDCIDKSEPLYDIFGEGNGEEFGLNFLKVECVGEEFPGLADINSKMIALNALVKERSKSMYSFSELLADEKLHSLNSANGLDIPVGYTTSGGSTVNMQIGNATPHYLVGGITGSGKSNFLHNMIMSACWNYSPDELEVYLLDFKEGVEFKIYADGKLPNAKLVATEADTEYGVKVLEHIDRERERRYKLFKKIPNCKDIQSYRTLRPDEKMPRILVIIDEFQRLFENAQKANTAERMLVIAKQGRACGIHMVLSTQTLKGLDFSDIATQFGGRIALKCSVDDSKLLLGGVTSGNEAASELTIPYAIMNVAQGNPADNQKFVVTEAMKKGSTAFTDKLEAMSKMAEKKGCVADIRVFEGQSFPEFPNEEEFVSKQGCVQITLGEALDYSSEKFKVTLEDQYAENIFVCCRDKRIKRSFVKMIAMSVANNSELDELIYIGTDDRKYTDILHGNYVKIYNDIVDFITEYKDKWFDSKLLVLFDNVNMASIGFPASQTFVKNPNKDAFLPFWNDCNKYGSHILALYDSANINDRGMSYDIFCHRIGFGVNNDDMNRILVNRAPKGDSKGRAFYANNLEIESWFRPFVEAIEEE